MVKTLAVEAVPLAQGEDGIIRVGGTRVQLETVILEFRQGATAEEIAQDYHTLTHERIENGEPCPGVFAMRRGADLGIMVEEILVIEQCSEAAEWKNQVVFLSLR